MADCCFPLDDITSCSQTELTAELDKVDGDDVLWSVCSNELEHFTLSHCSFTVIHLISGTKIDSGAAEWYKRSHPFTQISPVRAGVSVRGAENCSKSSLNFLAIYTIDPSVFFMRRVFRPVGYLIKGPTVVCVCV